MTQLYQRNSARHGLLARQGGVVGNHSGNGGLPVAGPLLTSSQATGMFTI